MEITESMLKAGAETLEHDDGFTTREEMARRIYTSMRDQKQKDALELYWERYENLPSRQ
jgi:hypothetical protein